MQPKLERQLTSNFDDFSKFIDDEDNSDMEVDGATEKITASVKTTTSLPPPRKGSKGVRFKFLTGEATDIGGGSENQDKGMLFYCGEDNRHLVMGVFDGHGRELGELAALVARDHMRDELQKPDLIKAIESNPTKVLEKLFLDAHIAIKKKFVEKFKNSGWQVTEMSEGYLTKRMKSGGRMSSVTNVHGGTTATVVIVLNGWRMIVANVGDSTALFGSKDPDGNIFVKELSAEHSPESIEEFIRVRNEMPSKEDSKYPSLRFVYDMFDKYQTPKYQCPQIFEVGKDPNNVKKTGTGYYFKNVRSEWATLVTTPPHAKFQDALAFTRSLGDLHLHVYGVSHVPEVREFDLSMLHNGEESQTAVLFVCTDGVWDNWKYEDIAAKTLDEKFIKPALEANDAQGLTDELMRENLKMARHNFGNQADNMTGIVCLIRSVSTADNL
mmetsp:Transcript_1137/g.1449  ORF Transcript_1137/g.1449 Transcript_1137/m.1449 type:complete len:440 (+) Transcript_1137:188-1507(+)